MAFRTALGEKTKITAVLFSPKIFNNYRENRNMADRKLPTTSRQRENGQGRGEHEGWSSFLYLVLLKASLQRDELILSYSGNPMTSLFRLEGKGL